LLLNDLAQKEEWIFGGSMIKWGITLPYSLVVFLYVPPVIRMERLKKREWERYGAEIFNNAKRNEQYQAFLEWAASYERPDAPGRSKKAHEEWFAHLTCPKMTIAGNTTVQERIERVMEAVGR
jgi:hypothetical protein